MLISRQIKFYRRYALAGLSALTLATALPAGTTVADESDAFIMQFHSFVPARESFKLPKAPKRVVWQSDMAKARQAWRSGKFANARKYLYKAREKGHVTASWYLGHLYQQGRGVKKNDALAFKYYREVAITYEPDMPHDGNLMIVVDARVRVADIYREGSSTAKVKQEPLRAYRIYNGASIHGHPGAAYGLGVMFLKGQGVKKNPNRALRLLSKAARKRYAPAEALLGDLHWDGKYVRKNRARALMYYILARETANPVVHRHIFQRFDEMLVNVSGEDQARAQGWADRRTKKSPTRSNIVPASD